MMMHASVPVPGFSFIGKKTMQIDFFIAFAYNIAELNISEFDFTISAQKGMSGCLSAEEKNWH